MAPPRRTRLNLRACPAKPMVCWSCGSTHEAPTPFRTHHRTLGWRSKPPLALLRDQGISGIAPAPGNEEQHAEDRPETSQAAADAQGGRGANAAFAALSQHHRRQRIIGQAEARQLLPAGV